MRHIEIHALQTLPPSRVNRGENGEPKTSLLGGVPRTRVSSQAQKAQQRQTEKTKRTKLPHELILLEITQQHDQNTAEHLRSTVISVVRERYGDLDDKNRLKTMVYLDQSEIHQLANLILADPTLPNLQSTYEKAVLEGKKGEIKEAKEALGSAINKTLRQYQPIISEDTALFGRFMADLDEEFVQAATSYAHAISTHRDQTVNDFFSAIDHYTGDSAHIGNIGLTAPTLYRYATLDLDLLSKHLGTERLREVAERWVQGFLFATPQGGGHGAFARTLPEYVLITLREEGQPVTLANAFTEPAFPRDGQTLLAESVRKLKTQAAFNQTAYGHNGLSKALEVSLTPLEVDGLDVQRCESVTQAFAELNL